MQFVKTNLWENLHKKRFLKLCKTEKIIFVTLYKDEEKSLWKVTKINFSVLYKDEEKSLWKCNKFYFLFFVQKSAITFMQTADWQTEGSVIRQTLYCTKALKDKSDIDIVTNDKVDNVTNVTNVISDNVINVTN